MRNNFIDSSSPTNQGTSEKEVLGGNKSNHTNLYMDDISSQPFNGFVEIHDGEALVGFSFSFNVYFLDRDY